MASLIFFVLAAAPGFAGAVDQAVAEQVCTTRGSGADVVVCGRRDRDEKFRMPGRDAPFDPDGAVKSVMREHMSWGDSGASGIQSCGPVGPGGWTGCMVREWDRQNQQSQYGRNRARDYR